MTLYLKTDRLLLNKIELSDMDNLCHLRADPDVMKYIGDGNPQTRDHVEEFLRCAIRYHEKYNMGFCTVFEEKSKAFVGQAGLFHLSFDDTQNEIEIAYRLKKSFWGRGFATELTRALIRWGFTHLNTPKLVAVTHPENLASQRVLQKAGMDFIGKKKWHSGQEVNWYEIYKNDSIQLETYNKHWPKMAEIEIQRIRSVLPASLIHDVQHVGSTAIPGMSAKPVIDLQIATRSLELMKPIAIDALKKVGYVYWAENPDPERMFFVKGMPPYGKQRTHHVHIVEPTSRHWQGKIMFRDYLISHPRSAKEYAELKMRLAAQFTYDREEYTKSKGLFIQNILNKAREL